MPCEPIHVPADSFGWVECNRLYWCRTTIGTLSEALTSGIKLPHDCVLQPCKRHDRLEFDTFTREFFHPRDHVREVSKEAAARFFSDRQRFSPAAYERNSLVWKGEKWRQPPPEERAQAMGIPPAALTPERGPTHHGGNRGGPDRFVGQWVSYSQSLRCPVLVAGFSRVSPDLCKTNAARSVA